MFICVLKSLCCTLFSLFLCCCVSYDHADVLRHPQTDAVIAEFKTKEASYRTAKLPVQVRSLKKILIPIISETTEIKSTWLQKWRHWNSRAETWQAFFWADAVEEPLWHNPPWCMQSESDKGRLCEGAQSDLSLSLRTDQCIVSSGWLSRNQKTHSMFLEPASRTFWRPVSWRSCADCCCSFPSLLWPLQGSGGWSASSQSKPQLRKVCLYLLVGSNNTVRVTAWF